MLPWVIAWLGVAALLVLIVARNVGSGTGASAPPPATDTLAPAVSNRSDAADAMQSPMQAGADVVRAPDISSLSPRERADRLFDRVMRLAQEGKRDSVAFFAPMVMSAYEMLGTLDDDQHYDLGRVGQVTGVPALAKAEADTILRAIRRISWGSRSRPRRPPRPTMRAAQRRYYQRLLAAESAELRKGLPEYDRHRTRYRGRGRGCAEAWASQWGLTQ